MLKKLKLIFKVFVAGIVVLYSAIVFIPTILVGCIIGDIYCGLRTGFDFNVFDVTKNWLEK